MLENKVHSLDGGKSYLKAFKDFYLEEPLVTKKPSKNIFKCKWVRLFVYLCICVLTTTVYYNWQGMQIILYELGVYEYLCENDSEIIKNISQAKCRAQFEAAKPLYTVALSAECALTVLAGVSLDRLGPLVTSVIGNIVFFLGWMLLFYSSASFPLEIVGMIGLGGAINFIAFPCFEIVDIVPEWPKLGLCLVVATQTLGTVIVPALRQVKYNNPEWPTINIVWGYLGFIVLPILILSLLVHPIKRICFLKEEYAELHKSETTGVATDGEVGEEISETKISIETPEESTENDEKPLSFYNSFISINFFLFLGYYVIAMLSNGYYPSFLRDKFYPEVPDFNETFLLTQALWCALFGVVVEYVRTLILCEILLIMYVISTFSALSPALGWQYISVIVFTLSNACIYTLKYTYVHEMFPKKHFGTVVGTIGTCAGLIVLVDIPLESVKPYDTMLWIFSILNLALLIPLFILQVYNKQLNFFTKCFKKTAVKDKSTF